MASISAYSDMLAYFISSTNDYLSISCEMKRNWKNFYKSMSGESNLLTNLSNQLPLFILVAQNFNLLQWNVSFSIGNINISQKC